VVDSCSVSSSSLAGGSPVRVVVREPGSRLAVSSGNGRSRSPFRVRQQPRSHLDRQPGYRDRARLPGIHSDWLRPRRPDHIPLHRQPPPLRPEERPGRGSRAAGRPHVIRKSAIAATLCLFWQQGGGGNGAVAVNNPSSPLAAGGVAHPSNGQYPG